MPHSPSTIRPAEDRDLASMSEMAASLLQYHHALDAQRFFLPQDVAKGYESWFRREQQTPDAILLVAEGPAGLEGYAYGRLEARDWNLLLDAHAALHDLFVVPEARTRKLGERLLQAFLAEAEARGAPRVVLHTATANTTAQALFARCGFRTTMLEMTCELEAAPASTPPTLE